MQKLCLKNVTLGYEKRVVLSAIDLEVASGELLGLVGPNGGGKSTLIKGITDVIPLQGGEIFFDDKPVSNMARSEVARIMAVVPQSASLPDAFTAFEVVLMGRTPHMKFLEYEGPKDIEIAVKSMELTDTLHLAERRVGELSGGEKQRLTIARALTQQPKIILLDEPTSNLDINYQVETLELILGLCKKEGIAALAALHDLNLAAQFCNRIVMLNNGRIFSAGTPKEVVTALNVKEVYGADVYISEHPVNKLPVTLITGNRSSNNKLTP